MKRSSAVGWFNVIIGTVSTGTVWVSMMLLGEPVSFFVTPLFIAAAVFGVGKTTRGITAFRSVSAYLFVISGRSSSDHRGSFGDNTGLTGTMPCSSSSIALIAAWERLWVVVHARGSGIGSHGLFPIGSRLGRTISVLQRLKNASSAAQNTCFGSSIYQIPNMEQMAYKLVRSSVQARGRNQRDRVAFWKLNSVEVD